MTLWLVLLLLTACAIFAVLWPLSRHAGAENSAALRRRRFVALGALVLLPAGAFGLYSITGAPQLPDQPIAARADEIRQVQFLRQVVARVEAQLAAHPDDGRGWDVIAPFYLRMGRAAEAVTAFTNAIRLLGSTPEREAGLAAARAQTEQKQ